MVVGAAGSGKTTLARAVAASIGVEAVDVDDLFWEPGWVQSDPDKLRAQVDAITSGDRWVVAGNYTNHLKALLWHRADTLVWLDLPGTPRTGGCSCAACATPWAGASCGRAAGRRG